VSEFNPSASLNFLPFDWRGRTNFIGPQEKDLSATKLLFGVAPEVAEPLLPESTLARFRF
jgi:hypothetical protein